MSEENRYSKKAKEVTSVFRSVMFWVLISFLISALIMVPIVGVRYYYLNYTKNELYTHTTSQGYNIVIYEKGHPGLLLSNHHRIVIEVDGEELLECTLLTDYEHRKDELYPKHDIVCAKDTENEYVIQFEKDSISRYVCFSADFSQVIGICAYEIDIIGDLEVIECDELDWF